MTGARITDAEVEALVATWPACDYWTAEADGELGHATVAAALTYDFRDAAQLTKWAGAGRTAYGYTRKVVTDADIDSMLEHLAEAFHEYWCDSLELGNPEADPEDTGEPEGLRAAVTADMRKRLVWQCEQTHAVTLTLAQILAVARWARPELFGGPT